MYLGGNGFYWRIARTGACRACSRSAAARAASAPGRRSPASTSELRRAVRRPVAPQRTAAAEAGRRRLHVPGPFEGSYYRRAPGARRSARGWIFDGVTTTRSRRLRPVRRRRGGLRARPRRSGSGTPPGAIVVARRRSLPGSYVVVPEELLSARLDLERRAGREADARRHGLLRAPNGGAVFSVGSITFCGSLSHNGYRQQHLADRRQRAAPFRDGVRRPSVRRLHDIPASTSIASPRRPATIRTSAARESRYRHPAAGRRDRGDAPRRRARTRRTAGSRSPGRDDLKEAVAAYIERRGGPRTTAGPRS